MSALERVTAPRVVAHAVACDMVPASLLAALRWEAGPRALDLTVARGRDRRAWNRQIGDQTVNVSIVLTVIPALLSGLLFWLSRLTAGPLTLWVTLLCWAPVALAIGGLVVVYLHRRSWSAWTADDVAESLAKAYTLRIRQAVVAGAVLAGVCAATLSGWL